MEKRVIQGLRVPAEYLESKQQSLKIADVDDGFFLRNLGRSLSIAEDANRCFVVYPREGPELARCTTLDAAFAARRLLES